MSKIVYIVGIGPGEEKMMSLQARQTMEECDIIVGYTVYVDLVRALFPDKAFMTTPMRRELERCRLCFDLAMQDKSVAMICSGDAGVYGMAAPILEMQEEYPEVETSVVAGITAANSGAAVLGAPLNHDFCVISLSDLLTPWEKIEARLRAAVMGDFAIVIYNPSSHKRKDYLKRACEILLDAGALPELACGYVENIGREGTTSRVCTLEELLDAEVNMFTTVFIGNSKSFIRGNRLITPRGYSI